MDLELRNRVARRILSALLGYSREFRCDDTLFESDSLGLTAADFNVVLQVLIKEGLAKATDDADCCVATARGLVVAADPVEIDRLLPIVANPDEPLPSELALHGTRPFERVSDIPPPITWEEYCRHLDIVWPRILNSSMQNDEAQFQSFLERHPVLLPNCFDCFRCGATPMLSAYFTQPELPGFRAKRPDFLTVVWDSDSVVVMLVEIEAPAKRWTTKSGTPSSALTQAIDQLHQWKAWFREPENVLQFQKLYRLDQVVLDKRQFEQRYALIYGRRSEATASPNFAKKRRLLAQPDEILMTYDRLRPSSRMGDSPTVRLDRSRQDHRLTVAHVPPTLRIGPYNADQLVQLAGLRDAIASNELISRERRAFLARRMDYWEDWAQQPLVLDDSRIHFLDYYRE